MRYTMGEAAEAMNGKVLIGPADRIVTGISHNSREAGGEDLFFAVIGERLDGHAFLEDAYSHGCRCFVISDEEAGRGFAQKVAGGAETGTGGGKSGSPDSGKADAAGDVEPALILVPDTVEAMTGLARDYLGKIRCRVVGVTGSTGKTSTRDMTAKVMSGRYKTGATTGNLNTVIGLSMTIMGFDEDTEVAVLEMGMDHRWEIDRMCSIAPPDIALITNIGITHMETLGSREEIRNAKMEITARLTDDDVLIANKGDYLTREALDGKSFPYLLTGADPDCDYRISNIDDTRPEGTAFDLSVPDGRTIRVQLPVPGRHNAFNAALALAAGARFGIDPEQGAESLSGLRLTGSRLRVIEHLGVQLIDDTYNANPDSMAAAADILSSMSGGKKYAVLSDMRELGPLSEERHRALGRLLAEKNIDRVFCFGDECRYLAESAGSICLHYPNTDESMDQICEDLCGVLEPGDVVLFKGSRSMEVERVLNRVLARDKLGQSR